MRLYWVQVKMSTGMPWLVTGMFFTMLSIFINCNCCMLFKSAK